MNKVYMAPYKRRNGEWTKRRTLLASFRYEMDMHQYVDRMRQENPTWIIEEYPDYMPSRSRRLKEWTGEGR